VSNKEFEDISIPKWKLSIEGVAKKVYRVYSTEKEFVTVEAESATEAAAKSNLKKVIMIKSGAMDDMTMLTRSMLFAQTVAAAVVEVLPPPVETPPASPVA